MHSHIFLAMNHELDKSLIIVISLGCSPVRIYFRELKKGLNMASHFNILSLKHTCIYVYVTITYFGDTLQQGPII